MKKQIIVVRGYIKNIEDDLNKKAEEGYVLVNGIVVVGDTAHQVMQLSPEALDEEGKSIAGRAKDLVAMEKAINGEKVKLFELDESLKERTLSLDNMQAALEQAGDVVTEKDNALNELKDALDGVKVSVDERKKELKEFEDSLTSREGVLAEKEGGLVERETAVTERELKVPTDAPPAQVSTVGGDSTTDPNKGADDKKPQEPID